MSSDGTAGSESCAARDIGRHRLRIRPAAPGRHRGLVASVALLGAACLLGCSATSTSEPEPEPEPASADTAPTSTIEWEPCDYGECAVIAVPLDHGEPDGPTIDLAIARSPAASPGERIGVLLVNPGGPGAPGRSLAAVVAGVDERLHERFDIIGWDPRGTGASRPLDCAEPVLDLYRSDLTATDDVARAAIDAAASAVGSACARDDSELLPHLDSAQSAADMDAIRAAIGEDTISYLGFSYGTVLGLRYAADFPDHLRVAVLDGVVDPDQDLETWLTGQAVAAEAVLTDLLAPCARCGDDPVSVLQRLVDDAERGAVDDDGVPLDATDIARAAIAAIYRPDDPSPLVAAVEAGLAGDGRALGALAESYLTSADFDGYTATLCLDKDHPVGPSAYRAFVDRAASSAPLLGAVIAGELAPCAAWPVDTGVQAQVAVTGTAPILMVGNLGDPVTPHRDAATVAARVPGAALLTHDGRGHTSLFAGDGCVVDTVVGALLDAAVPDGEVRCPR